ncbi:MAG: hypothetical protein HDT24_04305 [Ruminococcus sp.]|nr:hypothetical protein [Ruminococcus sp.]
MSDGKYSVDDILSEYSGSVGTSGANSDINIDDLIGGFASGDMDSVNNSISESAYRSEDDRGGDFAEPYDAHDNYSADTADNAGVTADKGGERDSFTGKYDRLLSAASNVRAREDEIPYTPAPKPDRSFSEKFEEPNLYGDKEEDDEDDEKAGIASLFKKRVRSKEQEPAPKREAPVKREAPIQSLSAGSPKAEDDPFEKYSSINDSSLDDILNEYSGTKKKAAASEAVHNTQHKSITDFFTKLVPKPDSSETGVAGNTELLDGMIKAKRERISRTQHVSPIERKSISDIDLDLNGKILPDTAQLPDTEQQSELEKINALKERRSKKIKDFVLVGDEEDVTEDEDGIGNEPAVIDDFENFNDAPSIAHDIAQLKGSLILRLFVLIICFAASLYIAFANDTQALPIMDLLNKRTETNTYLFVNAIIGLLACFASYTVISCGLSKLLSLKADCDSLCAVSAVSSIASAMIMFANGNLVKGSYVHVYIPVAVASLLFNTLGKLFIVNRTQRSFRFVSGSGDKYAIFPVEDEETAQSFTRGALSDFPRLAAMRRTELISDFLKTSYSGDGADRFCRVFTPIALAAAAAIGLIAGFMGRTEHGSSSMFVGISVFVGVVAICAGFSIMLVVNLPMLRASEKNSEMQGVVIGYDSVEEFAETNSILVDAEQLFPAGSVRLSAIKVFSDTRIDEAIVEAASLTTQAGSILKNMFYDIIAGKTELLNPVESYIFEDSMGLCGWINNKRVLLGNRELMINHSIEGIPPLTKEKEYTENGRYAVYLSISGELSAMFLVEIIPTMEVKNAFHDLQRNGVYAMIRTVDSLVSINRLSELFEVSPEYLKLIPFRVHEQFAETTSYQLRHKATLACSGRFAAFTSLILSCRHMKTTIGFGIGLQAVAMLLGILICLAMVVIGSYQEISVSMEILYNFIFTAVLVVFQLFRRN